MGLIYSLIKCRMEEGEFTVLDATNAGNADIAKYRSPVKAYRYEAFALIFLMCLLNLQRKETWEGLHMRSYLRL